MESGATNVMGRRSAAGLIDVLVLALVFVGLAATIGEFETVDGEVTVQLNGAPAVLWLAIVLLYYFLSELLTARTPGKALLGLRVARRDGSEAGARAVGIRTVLRLVDALPLLYLVGFVCALATGERRQRIGDLAASTSVVRG